jgi:hypothetical protein
MTVISCSHYGHAFSFLQATKHKSSIVFWKEHRRDRFLAFPADVVGDDTDPAVLGGVVAGEEATMSTSLREVS